MTARFSSLRRGAVGFLFMSTLGLLSGCRSAPVQLPSWPWGTGFSGSSQEQTSERQPTSIVPRPSEPLPATPAPEFDGDPSSIREAPTPAPMPEEPAPMPEEPAPQLIKPENQPQSSLPRESSEEALEVEGVDAGLPPAIGHAPRTQTERMSGSRNQRRPKSSPQLFPIEKNYGATLVPKRNAERVKIEEESRESKTESPFPSKLETEPGSSEIPRGHAPVEDRNDTAREFKLSSLLMKGPELKGPTPKVEPTRSARRVRE